MNSNLLKGCKKDDIGKNAYNYYANVPNDNTEYEKKHKETTLKSYKFL